MYRIFETPSQLSSRAGNYAGNYVDSRTSCGYELDFILLGNFAAEQNFYRMTEYLYGACSPFALCKRFVPILGYYFG